jgi:hypothetical protein
MTINGAALWLGFISLHLLLLRVLCEDVAVNGTNESVTLLAGETQSELVRRMTRRISKSTLPLAGLHLLAPTLAASFVLFLNL